MKKIIFIITSTHWGGAQRYVFDISKAIKNDFNILVASGKEKGQLLNKLKQVNIKTKQLKYLIRKINPFNDILALLEITILYNKEKPDIVHLNSSKAGILGSLAKTISGHKPKIIYTVHGWVFMEPMGTLKRKLYIFLERIASKFRDKIIVLSESEKKLALQNKICKKEKIVIIPNAIKELKYITNPSLIKEKLKLPINKKIIGTISGFYKNKGLEYLLKVAKELPQFYFVIIGDGPDKIKDIPNNVKLLGYIPDASKYIYGFDIFVLPSIKEGRPYAIMEAMLTGIPIIATKVGAIKEMLINYKNKILVEPKNIEALKDAIKKIKPNKSSPIPQTSFDILIEKTKSLYN